MRDFIIRAALALLTIAALGGTATGQEWSAPQGVTDDRTGATETRVTVTACRATGSALTET